MTEINMIFTISMTLIPLTSHLLFGKNTYLISHLSFPLSVLIIDIQATARAKSKSKEKGTQNMIDLITVIVTVVNACFTLASVFCAIISVRQTRKQNNLMADQVRIAQEQLEESRKPDFPTTMRLESIANSIRRLDGTINNYLTKK